MAGYAIAGITHDVTKIIEIIELIVALLVLAFIVSKISSDIGIQVTMVILVLGMIIFFA